MAIAMVRDLPNATSQIYDAVVREMGLDEEPAAGLIIHTAGEYNGIWREVDVWESREAFETFLRDRIMPAVVKVVGEEALNTPPPEPQFMEVYDLIQ